MKTVRDDFRTVFLCPCFTYYISIISIFAISTYYSDVAIKEYNKSKLTKKDNKKIVEEA